MGMAFKFNLTGWLQPLLFWQKKSPLHWYNQGVVALHHQQWPQSVAFLQRCLKQQANFADAHYNLGLAYQQQQLWPQAQDAFKAVLTLNPTDADALYNLGVIALHAENWAEATEHFQAASASNPSDPAIYVGLGLACKAQQDWANAYIALDTALSLDPENPDAHYYTGFLQVYYSGQIHNPEAADTAENNTTPAEAALQHLTTALQAYPEDPELHLMLSELAAQQGDWVTAMNHALQCVRFNPDHAQGYNQLGLALYEQNQCDEALVHFQHALAIKPDYTVVYNHMAFALEKNNQLDDALDALLTYLDTLEAPEARSLTETRIKTLMNSGAKLRRFKYQVPQRGSGQPPVEIVHCY
jgi:tetratricopeptide (TPR) repeat protein